MQGVIVGSAFGEGFNRSGTIATDYGEVDFMEKGDLVIIQRHGKNIPPHKINHKANISAFNKLGVSDIIAFNSVGSLKRQIAPGSIVIPDDYIDLRNELTFYDDKMVFTVPGLDDALRKKMIMVLTRLKMKYSEGVYVQTRGPRFETKAEVAMLSQFADIVGMTMASEATLAKELGLRYVSICVVDNYANGVAELSIDIVAAGQMQTKHRIDAILDAMWAI